MELIALVLVPLPLGLLVRKRLVAFVSYIAVHAFVFTVQTLSLLIEWVGGDQAAFGPYPRASQSDVFAYMIVNGVIYVAGLGLVYLGSRLRARRARRPHPSVPVDLDAAVA